MPPTGPRRPPLPDGFGLRLDPGTRRIEGGTVLVGGAPLRILRLADRGVTALDRLVAGATLAGDPAAASLARRLTDAGLGHPVPPTGAGSLPDPTVGVVVPVRDDPAGLERLLASLHRAGGAGGLRPEVVVVVDDGSHDAGTVARRARPAGGDDGDDRDDATPVRVVRHRTPLGPGPARGSGVAATTTGLVAFLDADVSVPTGWLGPLVAHFRDPCVGAVAPRVRAATPAPGTVGRAARLLAAYDRVRSPLDLGPRPASVHPGGPVPYVPTAALVVSRAAFEEVGGFDPDLRRGEDVDLVWRLHRAGWVVRYEPAVAVDHAVRRTLGAWLRQRVAYGTSAAPLAQRHPGALAPVRVARPSAAAWAAVAAGRPVLALAVASASTAALGPRLRGLRHPWAEAARLAGRGHLAAGGALAAVLRREWWPLAAIACRWPRCRPALAAAVVGVPLARWWRGRPAVGPGRWVALHVLDDAAYGAGVWLGCLRHRTLDPLRPDLSSWPGRRPPVEAERPAR